MLKPELYKKSTDVLFEAYFNNTLAHGYCTACAVGNLVAAGIGCKIIVNANPINRFEWDSIHHSANTLQGWPSVFVTTQIGQRMSLQRYEGSAKIQIDSTGYTVPELAAIELAFETAEQGDSDEAYMFNGLVAVIDVLNQIHEVDQDEQKPRFEAHYRSKITA